MNRGSFLRSLFVIAASPKILAEIHIQPKVAPSALFHDLKMVIPEWVPLLVEKYGDENFTWWLSEFSNHSLKTTTFHHFDEGCFVKYSEMMAAPPVTITLTKENYS